MNLTPILAYPLQDVEISPRTFNACRNYLKSIGVSVEWDPVPVVNAMAARMRNDTEMITSVPGMGKVCLKELKDAIEKLAWNESHNDYVAHKCLNRVHLVIGIFNDVREHQQVRADQRLSDLADKAQDALLNLYAEIGSRVYAIPSPSEDRESS